MNPHSLTPDSNSDANLSLRPIRWDDAPAITHLVYEICEAEGDTSVAMTQEDLLNEWKYEGFDPQRDAVVLETDEGSAVAYGALFDVCEHYDLSGDVYVHPNFKTMGIYTDILRALEIRADRHTSQAASHQRVFVRVGMENKDETGQASLTTQGYSPIRYHWRMGIELDTQPLPPNLPAGLEIRPFVKELHAQAVWQARNEAFKDNWGSHVLSFEEFSYYSFENARYDPTLWVVIWDGEEVAGFSINQYRMDIGWIHILGVRPAWRKQGLGLAMLFHSFAEFYRRGTKSIGLGVDASNLSGATRLYQKVGMSIVNEFTMYEKELRPANID